MNSGFATYILCYKVFVAVLARRAGPHHRSMPCRYPDAPAAAKEQSATPEEQQAINEDIKHEMRSPASSGATPSSSQGRRAPGPYDRELEENLHDTGP